MDTYIFINFLPISFPLGRGLAEKKNKKLVKYRKNLQSCSDFG